MPVVEPAAVDRERQSDARPESAAVPGPAVERAASSDPRSGLTGGRLAAVVVGAGQAGLSAAYYLAVRGLRPWRDFVVLDANDGPGGAWRHRWDSLTLGRAHGIHSLPGAPFEQQTGQRANLAVPAYYGDYERRFELPVVRPVEVRDVRFVADASGSGAFELETTAGRVVAETMINATGTWDTPLLPLYPGASRFGGLQVHTRDFRDAAQFAGRRVLVVGGGTSALQFIQELDRAGVETVWSTRRAPQWVDRSFDEEWGLDVERLVSARTRRGLPPLSVSAATGIPLNDLYLPDIASGLLVTRGRLVRFTETGAVLDGPGPDGSGIGDQGAAALHLGAGTRVAPLPGHPTTLAPAGVARAGAPAAAGGRAVGVPTGASAAGASAAGTSAAGADARGWEVPVGAVLWATGFRPHIEHLRRLGIAEPGGGVLMADDGVTVVKRPGLFLAGYGASASTLGATRAGRKAAMRVLRTLRGVAAGEPSRVASA